jgi:hypothetical protein
MNANKRVNKKKVVNICFGLLLAVAFIILASFIITFWGPISHDLNEWYEYGSFLAFIVSLINLACFISLTYSASVFQENSYEKQLRVQKIELQTSFRKSHIEDIHRQLCELSRLPIMKTDSKDAFNEFMVSCKSMIRIFAIYEENNNNELYGKGNYKNLNQRFEKLDKILLKIYSENRIPSEDEKRSFDEIFKEINGGIIALEKELSNYTLDEFNNAFNNTFNTESH